MRGLTARAPGLAALAAALAFGCGSGDADTRLEARPEDPEALARALHAYATEPGVARAALEGSLVRTDNAYAALRLARYEEGGWGALPEHDPETTPLLLVDAAPGVPSAGVAWSSLDPDAVGWSRAELRALGERAFFRYPVQIAATLPVALRSEDRAGMWTLEGRTGAVWARLAGGNVAPAFTCATCHGVVENGAVIAGKNNADLDAGRLQGDGVRGPRWGLGKVDVTGDGVEDPVAITDLRPVRWQANLHHAATLRNDPVALAVRIETLIITSQGQSVRPPKKIAAALAMFLLELGTTSQRPGADARGVAVFDRECGSCHRGDGASGPPVPFAAVGTDPLVGQSKDRGTGAYRVPSLRSVGDRRRLFASGAVEDLEELLGPRSPERLAKGHPFGVGLDPEERAGLLDYLRRL